MENVPFQEKFYVAVPVISLFIQINSLKRGRGIRITVEKTTITRFICRS